MVVDMENTCPVPAEDIEGDPLWSVERTAAYMEVSVVEVRRWIKQGLFRRVVRFGPKLLRLRKSDVEAFIESHYQVAS